MNFRDKSARCYLRKADSNDVWPDAGIAVEMNSCWTSHMVTVPAYACNCAQLLMRYAKIWNVFAWCIRQIHLNEEVITRHIMLQNARHRRTKRKHLFSTKIPNFQFVRCVFDAATMTTSMRCCNKYTIHSTESHFVLLSSSSSSSECRVPTNHNVEEMYFCRIYT